MTLVVRTLRTPLGDMVAACTAQGICLLEFAGQKHLERELRQVQAAHGDPAANGGAPMLDQLQRELDEYFAGRRRDFDVALDIVGTSFQKQVWQTLLEIPYGQVWSYGQEAAAMGRPTAVRAVASANGNNKISLVIPCHRVIGGDGSLTGYGGGLPRKQWLLTLEKTGVPPPAPDLQADRQGRLPLLG